MGHQVPRGKTFNTKKIALCLLDEDVEEDFNENKTPFLSITDKEDITINTNALKVEKQNAKAMVEGFLKGSERYYSSIFTAHRNAQSIKKFFWAIPKLLTTLRGKQRSEYLLSQIGRELHAEGYELPLKYIAILDRILYVNNNIQLWEKLCNCGIFDIWDPRAPYASLDSKTDPMILVLRVFEINHDFHAEVEYGNYIDIVPSRKVSVIKPIIPKNNSDIFSKDYDGTYYFDNIIEVIKSEISEFIIKEELVRDTSSIYLSS